MRKLPGVMIMFYISIGGGLTQAFAFIKVQQLNSNNLCVSLYVKSNTHKTHTRNKC